VIIASPQPFILSFVSDSKHKKYNTRRSNNMNKRPPFLKPLLWAYAAVGAFTAISVIVPVIWDRLAKRADNNENRK